MRLNTARRLRARPGMTMVEMMVVTVLLAIVGGGVMSMLAKQQAFYRSTSDVMDVRSQLRQAAAIIASDLRGVSSVGGDIKFMNDTSIAFAYTIGSSIVCSTLNSTNVYLPPNVMTNASTLSSWVTRPARGDTVYMFDTTTSVGWRAFPVDTVIYGNNLCSSGSNPYTQSTDNGNESYQLRVSSSGPSIPGTVIPGSPVRFTRYVLYTLYKPASDTLYYLGYCSPATVSGGAAACANTTSLQPVAGPFNRPATAGAGTSGLRFTYYDVNGNAITGTTATDRANVSRINFVLRGQGRGRINVSGMGQGVYMDSLRTDVALRNRS